MTPVRFGALSALDWAVEAGRGGVMAAAVCGLRFRSPDNMLSAAAIIGGE